MTAARKIPFLTRSGLAAEHVKSQKDNVSPRRGFLQAETCRFGRGATPPLARESRQPPCWVSLRQAQPTERLQGRGPVLFAGITPVLYEAAFQAGYEPSRRLLIRPRQCPLPAPGARRGGRVTRGTAVRGHRAALPAAAGSTRARPPPEPFFSAAGAAFRAAPRRLCKMAAPVGRCLWRGEGILPSFGFHRRESVRVGYRLFFSSSW